MTAGALSDVAADADAPDSATFVQSLARGLAVIRVFDAEHPALSLSEVAERAGISRAAARRFLLTFEQLGYVRSEARDFSLTPRVLELGASYLSALSLPELAQPHLERLSAAAEESVSATVLDGLDIVYVARAATRRILSVNIAVGTRFRAHATSMGRVLIASLPEPEWERFLEPAALAAFTARTQTDPDRLRAELRRVREAGWAEVDDELEDGLRSVAVPVRGRKGVVAAINIATGAGRERSPQATARDVRALTATAHAIEADVRSIALARR